MSKNNIKLLVALGLLAILTQNSFAQKPYRVGTTSANFLELGYGSTGIALGDAYVAAARDVSSIYWNPAGLGYLKGVELQAMIQPWFAGISTSSVLAAYELPEIGTLGIGLFMTSYGTEEVTSMTLQDGTGEKFDGSDMSFNLSYGRRLADWFSFGAGVKYVRSSIWHESASAFALDLGAVVNTKFLSWTDKPGDGLNIGMSISNYGTRMTYDGIDLNQSIDIAPDEDGNYAYVPGRYELDEWELPLIFRIGVSFYPLIANNQKFLVEIDALHPNNNSESVNIGGQYSYNVPGYGEINLRAGYKGLFLRDSQYGLTLGFGVNLNFLNNQTIKIDYAYRKVGLLGNVHAYTIGFAF